VAHPSITRWLNKVNGSRRTEPSPRSLPYRSTSTAAMRTNCGMLLKAGTASDPGDGMGIAESGHFLIMHQRGEILRKGLWHAFARIRVEERPVAKATTFRVWGFRGLKAPAPSALKYARGGSLSGAAWREGPWLKPRPFARGFQGPEGPCSLRSGWTCSLRFGWLLRSGPFCLKGGGVLGPSVRGPRS